MDLDLIQNKIYEIRGIKVMFDFDLAVLYQVETKSLNLAVKRNILRFPSDFMFQLTMDEWNQLRFQFETSKRGGRRYLPYAFTEQGLAMLSGILNSEKAIHVNIAIMRAFVMIRQYSLTYKDLTDRLKEIDGKFTDVYDAINYLLSKDKANEDHRTRNGLGLT
jgi:hypothetical protein